MAWYNFNKEKTAPPTIPSIPANIGSTELSEIIMLNSQVVPKPTLSLHQDYVMFGRNNQFPIQLVELRNNSSLHCAILDGKANLIAGDGLIFADTKEESDEWLRDNFSLVPFWRKLNQVWWQVIRDQQTFGYSCFQVNYNMAHNKIVDINWVDTSRVVCGPKDANGNLTHFYYSSDWNNTNVYKPVRIDAYDPNNIKELKQLVWVQWMDNNMDYYALPTYFGSLKDIKSDALISEYNLNSISNGFSPTVAITMIKRETPEGKRKFGEKMHQSFTGIRSKLLTFFAESKDEAPIVQMFDAKNVDTSLITLSDQVTQKIITGHKVNPVICSIPIPGKLGYSNEVIQSYALSEAITFKPERSMMLDAFKEVLIYNGVTKVKVDVISPVKDLIVDNTTNPPKI